MTSIITAHMCLFAAFFPLQSPVEEHVHLYSRSIRYSTPDSQVNRVIPESAAARNVDNMRQRHRSPARGMATLHSTFYSPGRRVQAQPQPRIIAARIHPISRQRRPALKRPGVARAVLMSCRPLYASCLSILGYTAGSGCKELQPEAVLANNTSRNPNPHGLLTVRRHKQ